MARLPPVGVPASLAASPLSPAILKAAASPELCAGQFGLREGKTVWSSIFRIKASDEKGCDLQEELAGLAPGPDTSPVTLPRAEPGTEVRRGLHAASLSQPEGGASQVTSSLPALVTLPGPSSCSFLLLLSLPSFLPFLPLFSSLTSASHLFLRQIPMHIYITKKDDRFFSFFKLVTCFISTWQIFLSCLWAWCFDYSNRTLARTEIKPAR